MMAASTAPHYTPHAKNGDPQPIIETTSGFLRSYARKNSRRRQSFWT